MVHVVVRSRPRFPGAIASGALLVCILHGCGRADDARHEVRAPGDVPWLGSCAEDTDCSQGQCLCGMCSAPCVDGACSAEGPPNAQCLEPEHWLSAALCAGRDVAPMCVTGCEATNSCVAGFDCLDGFCVPSPGAAIAREEELIPVGPLCERDRVVWRSLFLERPEQVEPLRGCERIEGHLRVDADEVTDLSALGSLRVVGGSFDVLGREPISGAEVPQVDLRGLERLERVGRLRIVSVTIPTLAALGSLRAIEGRDDSGLYLSAVRGLTSLDGLGGLERVQRIELSDVPNLTSLRGLASLRQVESIDVRGMPLEELAEPGHFVLTGSLNLEWTAVTTLQGLAATSRPSIVRLINNERLVSLEGLRVPETLEEMELGGNPALEDVRALEGLREVSGDLAISACPLRSLAGLDALERVEGLGVNGTAITDLSGLGRLTSADGIYIGQNTALTTLAGLAPAVGVRLLAVYENPSLARISLGNARIEHLSVSASPIVDLQGLEGVTLSHELTLDGVPNLVNLAGLPAVPPEFLGVSLTRCPALADIGVLAGLSSLGSLVVSECGIANLDALGNLQRLGSLDLYGNPNLTQIDAVAQVSGLTRLSVLQSPVLVALPSFDAVVDESDPEQCGDECGLLLQLTGNASLQQGPGFPALARSAGFRVDANPSLAALGSFAALRSVFYLQVEGNPALALLGLSGVQSASAIIVRGNAALPESELAALRTVAASESRIASNGAGPDRLDPCPWASDGVCDEDFEACASGSDSMDCFGREVPAWGMIGSFAP